MTKNKIKLSVKDHSVSEEMFQLVYNENYKMFETFPKPALENLSKYYQSEDYISHTDSKRSLFEKTYQFIKRISLKRKLGLINTYASNERELLDVGCGTGEFLFIAQNNDWKITGIEPNKKARTIANTKTNNKVFNIDKLTELQKGSFQIITLWHVLEHLPDLDVQLAQFKKLLKPNGVLIIAVPNYKSYDARYYKNFWAAFDVPRHLWHFSKTSIKKLMALENLQVEKCHPMFFDAFYVSLLSEKYKYQAMNPFRAFWIGWLSNFKARKSGEYSSLIYIIKKKEN